MLAVSWDTIRLFLHVLAATIWVGGQLVLAALVPVLRRAGVVTEAARRFNQVAWAAFAVLVATGIWNIAATPTQVSHNGSYRTTLIVKLVVVLISGVTAALHIRSRPPRGSPTACRWRLCRCQSHRRPMDTSNRSTRWRSAWRRSSSERDEFGRRTRSTTPRAW